MASNKYAEAGLCTFAAGGGDVIKSLKLTRNILFIKTFIVCY